jgi:hypothetical protein
VDQWVECRCQRIVHENQLMRTRTRIALWTSVAVLVAAVVLAWNWLHRHPFIECEDQESVVADDNPAYQVVLVTRLCNGIAGSDDVSVMLLDDSGKRVPILQYGAAYSFVQDASQATPVFEWKSDTTLAISIEKVAYITTRVAHAGDVLIETRIGSVIAK